MSRRILIPSDYKDENLPAGRHFGRAKWYLVFDDQCNLIDTIPGLEKTHHGLIFKSLKQAEIPVEAALVFGTGSHAIKIMEKWNVQPIYIGNCHSALDAARAYFEGELTPLNNEAVHDCNGHVH